MIPFAVHDGRIRAQREDTSLSGTPNGKSVLIEGFCLHGESLDTRCADCVADLPLCGAA